MEAVEPTPKTDHQGALTIGWIGAGKMGAPMIRNLMADGQPVRVTEPAAEQLAPLIAAGPATAATLEEQAGSDIVFATLPNDPVLIDVVCGGRGPALAGLLAPGTVFVEMSTVSPEASARVGDALREAGIHYLRAPISGSTQLAEQAMLTVLASGDTAAWEAAEPYLARMSARRFYLGAGEEARYMKLVLNTLVGASSAILAEALALGSAGGLSRADMMGVIGESAVASPLLKYKAEAVAADDYTPAFTIAQMIKDFTLISDASRARGVPHFTTSLILELYRAAANAGLQDEDFFALVKFQSDLSPR